MNKKNYLWLALAVVVVALAIYLVVSWPKTEAPAGEANVATNEQVENGDQAATSSDGTSLPQGVQPVVNPATDPGFSKEVVIKVDEDGKFSPKTIEAKAGTKAFLTFSAADEARHTFSFSDPSLDFLLVVFDKAEGDKSITFPAPEAGSYTFQIDSEDNQGTLIVK